MTRQRLIQIRQVLIALLFDPHDLWIGVFWKRDGPRPERGMPSPYWHVYVCIVPCLPIHILWRAKEKPADELRSPRSRSA
jgi:hypothetical protein